MPLGDLVQGVEEAGGRATLHRELYELAHRLARERTELDHARLSDQSLELLRVTNRGSIDTPQRTDNHERATAQLCREHLEQGE